MTGGASHPSRLLWVFLGFATPLLGALAQSAPAPASDALPTYVDRVIENLPPEPAVAREAYAYDPEGLPRFLRLETRLGTEPFDPTNNTRIGHGIYGLIETPNHGVLTIDGAYAPRDSSGTVTLRQRAMPLPGGWQASNELGVINTPAPPVTRQPSRVYLPSAILQGVGTEWENPARGVQLQASTGQPGQLEFLPASGFRRLPGRRTTLGAQWWINPTASDTLTRKGWIVALKHEDARDVSILDTPLLPSDIVDADATLLALRHEGEEHHIQAQVVRSRTSQLQGDRSGFWIDGEWDDGPRRYGAGAYRLDRDLSWAHLPLANNVVGAYLRSSWRTRQWSAEGSADWLDSLSGPGQSGYFATGSARWRLNRDHSLGAGATVRRFNGNGWSTYGDWRVQNSWGASGWRLEFTGDDSQADSRGLSWDQEWLAPQGWSLSTSLGATTYEATASESAETAWNAAVSLSAPLTGDATLRGNFNTERSNNGEERHSLNLGTHWRIDNRWSLEGSYNRSTGRSRTNTSLDPLAPPLPVNTTQSDRSFFAVLRYEWQAGSRSAPLGGRPQEGGGRIEGVVYLDANRNGNQEASETGAAGVTVYLDNRYATRTDAQGRFEFPFVATGPRTVTVRNETLPLPWSVVDEGQVKVDVRLRDSVRLDIPVQKTD